MIDTCVLYELFAVFEVVKRTFSQASDICKMMQTHKKLENGARGRTQTGTAVKPRDFKSIKILGFSYISIA